MVYVVVHQLSHCITSLNMCLCVCVFHGCVVVDHLIH